MTKWKSTQEILPPAGITVWGFWQGSGGRWGKYPVKLVISDDNHFTWQIPAESGYTTPPDAWAMPKNKGRALFWQSQGLFTVGVPLSIIALAVALIHIGIPQAGLLIFAAIAYWLYTTAISMLYSFAWSATSSNIMAILLTGLVTGVFAVYLPGAAIVYLIKIAMSGTLPNWMIILMEVWK